jgi:transcription elongation factor/antiterminator RfaH
MSLISRLGMGAFIYCRADSVEACKKQRTDAVDADRDVNMSLPRTFEDRSVRLQPPSLTGQRWHAVHTLPMKEDHAQFHLENQFFSTFVPRRPRTVRHARKTKTIAAPYFPRYLFVALDLSMDPWRKVNGTFGVSRLVMRGDEPQPVPKGVVETLVALTDSQGFLKLEDKLKIGGSVRLMAGPFADHLAILDHLDDTGRVSVLLEILGRRVRVDTTAGNLLPLS